MNQTVSQNKSRRRGFTIFAVVVLVIGCGAVFVGWLWHGEETTDDAFIDGHVTAVSPQIAGRVELVQVEDNQHVNFGQVLVTLDAVDMQNALQDALDEEAITASLVVENQAQRVAVEASLGKARANVELAEANFRRDERERQRYLQSGTAVSRSDLDYRIAQARSSEARLNANRQEVIYTEALLKKVDSMIASSQTSLNKCHTAVTMARLQLSRTQIIAPTSGYVTKRTAEPGNIVEAGSTLLYVVSDRVWVTANFKESQLRHMRRGQNVMIEVDAWPDQQFKGHIDSMQRATGSVFNLLPAENATGNYVKIVQRVPVKIVFDDPASKQVYLAPGMSVIPHVDVRN